VKSIFAIPLTALLLTGAVVCVPAPIHAQIPQQKELPPPARTINLTLEQRHVIKEFVKDVDVGKAPADVPVSVGAEVPEKVVLHDVPAELGRKVPQIKTHKFVVVQNKVVLVDPKDRKIAEVIE